MNVGQFRTMLAAHPEAAMHWMLPDRSFVPGHYHVTEVGRVRKDFIDCGGTVRSVTSCLLQLWVASDTDHRLAAGRLARIMEMAAPLLEDDDIPVEIEYEDGAVSQYPLAGVEVTPGGLLWYLGTKHTACLAPEQCGGGDCC